ncbi:ATP-binding cassette domain-containing protein [Pediococcus pentosaceus]|uniref:ABC transporter ATP-binding protein/permease n=1 Tax=Pediococcus pentosaceus TaxID=1255 RepID=UPI001909DB16|nr:ABC transporter ATP-binding protein/permease [Pediococcus pentosaceus]MBF7124599.1 ATP-binding cassette domain-containing protein [Pediococcus pentosaceus]WPK16438.1 ATP-binding cassette domain-containing protein [Pediococcus pentosaceus]
MSLLEVRDVHKSYFLGNQEFKVLKGINLQFDRGEFVSILGESGGGKSTLMNIIGGLDHQYEGDVVYNGQSLRSAKPKVLDAYRRENIGFIFQSFNLISHLNILDNVMVSLEMTKLSHAKRVERAKALLERVGLKEHMRKHPNQLSGGQKQRVAIARALAGDPDVIIADEPTGALDSQNTKEVLEILESIAKDGKLVIAVTHSQEVADFGTRVVHLDDGVIHGEADLRAAYPVPDAEKTLAPKHLTFRASLRMALKHMSYNLKRNLLIIFGASIGIFSVILMLGLGNGVTGYMNDQISSQINPTAVQVAKNVTQEQMENGETADLSNTDYQRMNKIKNVKSVERGYYVQSAKTVAGKKSISLQVLQTWNKTEREGDIKYGSKPGNGEILLDKATAKKFDKKYKNVVGKKITVFVTTADSKKQPVQLQKEVTVSGVITSGTSAIDYNTLKEMFKDKNLDYQPNFFTVNVNNTQNVKSVQNKIKNYKHDVKGKERPQYTITGVGAILDSLNTYIMLAFYVLAGIAGISLLVSAIMIIVVLYISVSERTKEIGILRAIGARRKDIRNLFVSEAFFLGLFSSILGSAFALLAQWGANVISMKHIDFAIIGIAPGYLIFGIAISIIISLLAAFTPSRKASKLDPVEALSAE